MMGRAGRDAQSAMRDRFRGSFSEPDRRGHDSVAPHRTGSVPKSPQRIKSLATVAAVSIAVALTSVAYGTWAALSAQASVVEASADSQSTLVVVSEVKAGDVLKPEDVEIREIPRSMRSGDALAPSSLEEDGSPVGKRVLIDVAAGTQIASSMLAGAGENGYLAGALGGGMQAVTIAVDAETGLAGQLRPTDRVRVVSLESEGSGTAHLTTICSDAKIVSLDGTSAETGSGYASVTVEVTPDQADAVRSAQYAGKVSLTLVAALDARNLGKANQAALDAVSSQSSDAQRDFAEGARSGGSRAAVVGEGQRNG